MNRPRWKHPEIDDRPMEFAFTEGDPVRVVNGRTAFFKSVGKVMYRKELDGLPTYRVRLAGFPNGVLFRESELEATR